MASLFKTARSKYWYVQYIDGTGKRRNVSTGLLHDDPKETAQARIVRAALESKEIASGFSTGENTDGWAFVPSFLSARSANPKTKRRYAGAWEWISQWLMEMGLTHPSQIRYRHGEEFARWRCAYKKRNTNKHVGMNTARLDAKIFAMIMGKAARLELCQGNPLVKMELPKSEVRVKPEISDAEFEKILPALDSEPAWMKTAFLIGMHTGCRLRETRLPMDGVDIPGRTIFFPSPKGGTKRAFSVPMPEQLVPLFESMKTQCFTLEFPFQPSRQWQHFFRRLGLQHLCFHCLRVTYITRLARRGVPLSMAMRLVNHASSTVHRIYQRIQVEDVRAYGIGLEVRTASSATPKNPQETLPAPSMEKEASASKSAPCHNQPPTLPPSPLD